MRSGQSPARRTGGLTGDFVAFAPQTPQRSTRIGPPGETLVMVPHARVAGPPSTKDRQEPHEEEGEPGHCWLRAVCRTRHRCRRALRHAAGGAVRCLRAGGRRLGRAATLGRHFGSTGWSQRALTGNTTTCADVHLPTGALLSFITTFTNDTDAGNDITYTLFNFQLANSTQTSPFTFTTSGAPGIQRVLRTVSPAVTIDNTHAYVLCIAHDVGGAANQSAGALLWYKLQVSPAPAVATFPNDVPTTHPFFRFVEAMAASGLTGGCSAGSFCPDQPVTRGQLSVFLSSALGLHFPN
jgi:S-layer homology domain